MAFADWLAAEAERVLLVTLTSDSGTHYLADRTWIAPPDTPQGMVATGGTVTDEVIGGTRYKVHTFTSSGTFTVTTGGDADYLIVGGGGSGGGGSATTDSYGGGGGGAGEIKIDTALFVAGDYAITIGAGGSGVGQLNAGNNGSPSSIDTIDSAVGGGGGGIWPSGAGKSGGSGGGGGNGGGTAIGAIGNDGGTGGGSAGGGGGGGGAGSVGSPGGGTEGGAGGNGYDAAAFGLSMIAGGGGGGRDRSGAGGAGGSGGGGAGGNAGVAGTANTGSGGGGMSADQSSSGAGGSGIVVIKYPAVSSVPANTVFDGRVIDAEVEWQMGAGLGRAGGANGGRLVVANPDGDLDDWLSEEWATVTFRYGDPSWDFADFKVIFSSHIDSIEAGDLEISFNIRDRYAELDNAIQTIFPVPSPSADLLYPLCYGYPRNITPIITEPNAAPEYRIGEPPCEDSAVTRYLNQKAFTSPGIAKINSSAQFDLDSDPNGRVTVDAKGKLDGSSTWIETLGAALKDALTRTHEDETGVLEGGSSTTAVLPDSSSAVDDYYNGKTIRKWIKADAAVGDHTTAESKTITDYDGATRTVTTSAWTTAAAAGDVYQISDEEVQAGPLATIDLDTSSFTQFDTDYPYSIGLFIDDGSTTARQMLDMALSPGAYHTWTTGVDTGVSQLKIGIIKDPDAETADFELGDNRTHGEIRRLQEVRKTKKLRLGFLKNHSVSTEANDAGAARNAFATEEFRWISKGSFVHGEDEQEAVRSIETLIVDEDDAFTELDRLWALMSVQRQMYEIPALLEVLAYGVGSVVEVTDDRHELSAKNLIVTGIRLDPLAGTTELECWG